MIIETTAIALAAWVGWKHAGDTWRKIFPRTTPGRYRRSLRRMAQRRYLRSTRTRQQVRVLEHVAWQMRADSSPPPVPVHTMVSVNVLPWLYLPKATITERDWEAQNRRYTGIARLIGRPTVFLPETESPSPMGAR